MASVNHPDPWPHSPAPSTRSVIINRPSRPGGSSASVAPARLHTPGPASSHVDLAPDGGALLSSGDGLHVKEPDHDWQIEDNMASLRFILNSNPGACAADELPESSSPPLEPTLSRLPAPELSLPADKSRKPFHKWMNTLRKRGEQRRRDLDLDIPAAQFLSIDAEVTKPANYNRHRRQSSSDSSFAFITALKSPSISLASFSVLGRSKLATNVVSSKAHSRTDRSSRASISGMRLSEDSQYPGRGAAVDPAIAERAMQRRRILEELINTEEGYIRDVRFLMNVYVTILASLPTQVPGLRSSINQNMTEIVELHEELLGELHRAVPHSEYTQAESPSGTRNSLGPVPEDKNGDPRLQEAPETMAEPQVAAEVARIFIAKMNRLFIYEEYGAKYELMMNDVNLARRTLADWEKYQRGLEALAASIGPMNSHDDFSSKKSLTIGDLLVKPIQRVCKYPLLFAELLKHTPVFDCPHSHMVIEDALVRLREATGEINRATDDPQMKTTLERTWLLQDRLVFPDQRLDAASKNRVRSFGHIQLCGVLHVCWQTKDTVTGQYLICLLYRDWLCIAAAGRADQTYTILLCIELANLKVEDADNGRGIQCHTAPYSWKLVFECDYELYEIVMTACSPKEGQEWRGRLEHSAASEYPRAADPMGFCALSLNIKSLGTVFGKPARRISIHRATTVGPKSSLCQVVLKNTSLEKETAAPSSASSKHGPQRSLSMLGPPNRVSLLTPSRSERARLEGLLSDVWTREVLPFPGMTVRGRGEHLVRTGASSMMRKLSVASIASTFSRRSGSVASISKTTSPGEAIGSGFKPPADLVGAVWAFGTSEERRGSCPPTIETKSVTTMPTPELSPDEYDEQGMPSVMSFSDTAVDKFGFPDFASQALPGSPVTPASSKSSIQLSRRPSARSRFSRRSSLAFGSEKGDMSQVGLPRASTGYRSSSVKSESRWTKVGGLHRGVMVQGIRGFFR
ncbi:hypothetical protein RB595_008470 [Gaeumannomyces hyphopodioides]